MKMNINPDLIYLSVPSKNNELLYSLRAVEEYGDNYGKIVVVGNLPRGIKPDLFIPHNRGGQKAKDIFDKTNLAAQTLEVSENFILMSDDYFFSARFDFSKAITAIRDYDLFVHGSKDPNNRNNMTAKNGAIELKKRGLPFVSYDLHYPMPMQKSKFVEIARAFDWSIPLSLPRRSIYGNFHNIQGIIKKDVKFGRYYDYDTVVKHPVWSTGDMYWCKKTMDILYPNKSRWET